MCFSPKISFSLFVAGTLLAYVSYVDPILRPSKMYILFVFYALMELLQTVQYSVVNQCDLPANIYLTEIAYLLVIVQPLMWNTIFYLRNTSSQTSKSIFMLAIVLCLLWIVMNVYTRLTYDPKTAKDNCGLFNHNKTCTYRDANTSHLYWRWKTNHISDMTANYFMYMCLWFVPALLVANTRPSGVVLTLGAILGFIITKMYGSTIVEFPATWCYISVPILIGGYLSYFLKLV